MMLLALRRHFESDIRILLFRAGAFSAFLGVLLQAGFAMPIIKAQPAAVMTALMADPIYALSAYAWLALVTLLLIAATFAFLTGKPGAILAVPAALLGFLQLAAAVMVRDGIRDVTLRLAGFEVWDRQVVTNWSVVGLFLVLFVAALAVIGYLIRVVASARRIEEKYA